ncbi:MAG: YdeI/OmpD-associated family protein [Candidatus Sericytochromatia bacterium]|nr:YdeI/OmpD-associated family protein [Candidatus Sericytochromatia bacterium]
MLPDTVDAYLQEGCGRCDLHRTPACKVHRWTDCLAALRQLLLEAGLQETVKWGSPCYTLDGKNVAMLGALKDRCTLQFFKGAALRDPAGLLTSPGPNSRHARGFYYRSLDEVRRGLAQARPYIDQAIALERAGVVIAPPSESEPLPEELAERLVADPELAAAFAALTPGRRRSHILHIAGAKQAATRHQRVARCIPLIQAGRGVNER